MHAAAVRGRAEIMQLLLSTRVPSLIRFSVTMSSNSSNNSSLSAGGFEAESPWFFVLQQKHGLHYEKLGRCSLGILILTLVSVGHHALFVRKETVMPTFSTKMCATQCLPSPQKGRRKHQRWCGNHMLPLCSWSWTCSCGVALLNLWTANMFPTTIFPHILVEARFDVTIATLKLKNKKSFRDDFPGIIFWGPVVIQASVMVSAAGDCFGLGGWSWFFFWNVNMLVEIDDFFR